MKYNVIIGNSGFGIFTEDSLKSANFGTSTWSKFFMNSSSLSPDRYFISLTGLIVVPSPVDPDSIGGYYCRGRVE